MRREELARLYELARSKPRSGTAAYRRLVELLRAHTPWESLTKNGRGMYLAALFNGATLDGKGLIILNEGAARQAVVSRKTALRFVVQHPKFVSPETKALEKLTATASGRKGRFARKGPAWRGQTVVDPRTAKRTSGRWHGYRPRP